MTNTASFVLEFLIISWLKGTDRPTVIQVHQLTCPGQPKTMTSFEFWQPPAQWKEFPKKHSVRPDIRLRWYNPVEKALITTNCLNTFTDSRGGWMWQCHWLLLKNIAFGDFVWMRLSFWLTWLLQTLDILEILKFMDTVFQAISCFQNIIHHKDHSCLFKQS